jgi:hypothetical protein
MEAKAFSSSHRTKVFADGTVRKSSVFGGTEASEPISASEMASEALSVVGRLSST